MRTKEQAEQMRHAIQTQLDELPAKDAWGSSNSKEKREMREQIRQLDAFIAHNTLPTVKNEVWGWLMEESWSFLGDYLS